MKIAYQTFFLVMKAKRKKQEDHYLKSHWRKVKKGDNASAISQEEEVPLKENFIDENLDINREGCNEPMEIIHESMKIIPGDHIYCLSNNYTPCYAYQDKSNLVRALVSNINKIIVLLL